MKRDLHDSIGVACLLVPTTVSSTSASSWVDLQGYQECELVVRCEALTGGGSITPSIETGDTTAASAAAAAATGDTVGTLSAIEAATDLVTQRAAYVSSNGKRYARIALTVAGSASATVSVFAIVGGARSEPAANPTVAAAT